jgi:16S rRNA (cytosine967-C5)-methyltransferase
VDLLLAGPLPARDAEVHDLLAIGLYQLEDTRVPDHAAVAATVEAARRLGRGQYAGLVNACLRRWLREREALKAGRAGPRSCMRIPAGGWMRWRRLAEGLGKRSSPQRTCRRRCGSASTGCADARCVAARLVDAGGAAASLGSRAGRRLSAAPMDVESLPGFSAGDVSVQDAAAQLAAGLLAAAPGMRVLDACAAPGGKSVPPAGACPEIELTALDIAPHRLERIPREPGRLGLRRTCWPAMRATRRPGGTAGRTTASCSMRPAPAAGSCGATRTSSCCVARRCRGDGGAAAGAARGALAAAGARRAAVVRDLLGVSR